MNDAPGYAVRILAPDARKARGQSVNFAHNGQRWCKRKAAQALAESILASVRKKHPRTWQKYRVTVVETVRNDCQSGCGCAHYINKSGRT